MDHKGYVMGGLSFLLVVPAILLVAVFVDISHAGGESTGTILKSDTTLYAAKDIEEDIPVQGLEVLREKSEGVVKIGNPVVNSRQAVKIALQKRMDLKTEEYHNSTGLRVNCTILNVNTASDPFEVEVNSTIYVEKDDVKHWETVNQNISIKDADSRIPDPLPFIKCKNYSGVTNTTDRILYGSSLANYLNARNISNATVYENATAPLFIKKCPYDPYDYHGTSNNHIVLKNCLENGYFHESSDGACFLCRLEGKSTCYHYGFDFEGDGGLLPSNSLAPAIIVPDDDYCTNYLFLTVFLHVVCCYLIILFHCSILFDCGIITCINIKVFIIN